MPSNFMHPQLPFIRLPCGARGTLRSVIPAFVLALACRIGDIPLESGIRSSFPFLIASLAVVLLLQPPCQFTRTVAVQLRSVAVDTVTRGHVVAVEQKRRLDGQIALRAHHENEHQVEAEHGRKRGHDRS